MLGAQRKSPTVKLGLIIDIFGSPTWTRTRDLRINSPSLYRLSYQGIVVENQTVKSGCYTEALKLI